MATSSTAARTFGGTNDLFTAALDYKVTMNKLGVSGRELNLRAEHQTTSYRTGYEILSFLETNAGLKHPKHAY